MINIQNTDDNECFRWCLVSYLHPTYHNPRRIIKVVKLYGDKLDFKDIKFPVKLETLIKLKEKIPLALVFLIVKIRKISNICVEKML